MAMQLRQELCPPQQSIRVIGLAGDRAIEAQDGIGLAVDGGKRHAAIEPVFDRTRRQGQRAVIAFDRLGIAAKVAENVAAIAMRLRQIRRERNGALEACQRMFALTERAQ